MTLNDNEHKYGERHMQNTSSHLFINVKADNKIVGSLNGALTSFDYKAMKYSHVEEKTFTSETEDGEITEITDIATDTTC